VAKIILLTTKNKGKNWRLEGGNIKNIIEDSWKEHIMGSDIYLEIIQKLHGKELPCVCDYPIKNRPMPSPLLGLYQGCVFDLDSHNDGDVHLATEIKSVPGRVYVGCVSTKIEEFASQRGPYFYPYPISNSNDFPLYLWSVSVLILMRLDEANKRGYRERLMEEKRRLLSMDPNMQKDDPSEEEVLKLLGETLNFVKKEKREKFVMGLIAYVNKDVKNARIYSISHNMDFDDALREVMIMRPLQEFCIHGC
jgi:hypothetical protein